MANTFSSHNTLKDFIEADEQNSIRLLYPNLDFNFSYGAENEAFLRKYFDDPTYQKK